MSEKECFEAFPCGKDDYDFSLTQCVNDKQTKKYKWDEPLLCQKKNMKLPQDEELECLSCIGGYYNKKVKDNTNRTITMCDKCCVFQY